MAENVTFRTCKTCAEDKPLTEFYKRTRGKDGRYNFCKPCYTKKTNVYLLSKYGTYRNFNLIKEHGITSDDYDVMYEAQKGLCGICERPRTLVVDHDHITGRIRGLLCTGCNTSLGKFQDGKLLDKAKEYVKWPK